MKTSLALEPDLPEQLVEQLARPAHEREPLLVLVQARRLAHEHQVGVGVAGAEHQLGAGLDQRAARAVAWPRGRARPAPRGARLRSATWHLGPAAYGRDATERRPAVSLVAAAATRPWSGPDQIGMQLDARRHIACPAGRLVVAGRLGTALAAALERGADVAWSAPSAAARCRPAADAIAALRARRRDPRRRRGRRGAARWSATPAAPPAERPGAAGAPAPRSSAATRCRPSPAPARPAPFARRRLRDRRLHPRGARRSPASLAAALGMRPFELDDDGRAAYHAAASIASNFLVTLQAAAERVAAGAGLEPAEARARCWRRSCGARSTTGPRTAPSARSPAPSPAATTQPWRASARPSDEAAPELLPLFDELVERTRAGSPAGRRRHEDRPHRRRAARAAGARAPGGPPHRAGADDGRLPRRPPVADAPGARATATWWWSRCSSTRRSSAPARTSPPTRATRQRDAALAAGRGRGPAVRARREEVYPDGFATTVRVGGLTEVLCGDPARRGPEHFDGRDHGRRPSCFNMVAPDVAYFGQKDAQQALVIRKLVRDLDIPVRDRGLPDRARSRRPGAELAQRLPLARRARAGARPQPRSAGGPRRASPPGSATPAAVLAAARGELDAAGLEPEYLELRSTDDLAPVERVNGSTLLAVAARVGRARLIDNAILGDTDMRRTLLKSKIHRATVTGSDLNYVGSITRRPRPARGRRHPRARAGARARRQQRRPLRDLHDRRRARLGRGQGQRRRRAPGAHRRQRDRGLVRRRTTRPSWRPTSHGWCTWTPPTPSST